MDHTDGWIFRAEADVEADTSGTSCSPKAMRSMQLFQQ
jgi:hypothetical protein